MPPRKEKIPCATKGMCAVMGTFVTITVVSSEPDQAKRAIRLAFREIFRINSLMSVHRVDSEVSQLNKNGFHDHLTADTSYVIQRALYFSELTDGAFDVTILPVLELWENYAAGKECPPEAELIHRLTHVGYRNVEIEGRRIRFLREGMRLTLAGVAKGYAVDRAAEILVQNHIRHALVNGGGDIRAVGGKTDDTPWRIGLRDPLKKAGLLTTVELKDQAIATSGTYQRRCNDLLNPREGRPAREILSTTIITEKTTDADALATAFLVLGGRKGRHLLERFGEARALYVTGEGHLLRN